MYPPTTVSVGPIRSQKERGVRKTRKRTTKRKRKRRQSTKRKINVNKLIQKILCGAISSVWYQALRRDMKKLLFF